MRLAFGNRFTRLFLVFTLAVILGTGVAGCGEQPQGATHPQGAIDPQESTHEEQQPPELTNEELTKLVPGGGWHVLERTSFTLKGHPYVAAVIGAPDYVSGDGFWNVQAVVLTFRQDKERWVAIWRSSERSAFTVSPEEPPKVDLRRLGGSEVAWLLVDVVDLGASNATHSFTILRVGPEGDVSIRDEWDMLNAAIDVRESEIVIRGSFPDPQRVIRLQGNDIVILTQRPSEVAGQEAAETGDHVVEFILKGTKVRPVGSGTLTVKAGDTVVFVPADQRTRKAFDDGDIEIYSDAWNGPPIAPANAYELDSTSYTFTATGEFHFGFVYWPAADPSMDVVEPAITVIVVAP